MASSCVSTYMKSGDIRLTDGGSGKSECSEQGTEPDYSYPTFPTDMFIRW